MIVYEHTVSSLIFRAGGSVLPRAALYGLVSAVATGLLYTDIVIGHIDDLWKHPYAHQVFSISVGFVLVFRCNLSYQRFWEGTTQLQLLSAKLVDGLAELLTFDHIVDHDEQSEKTRRVWGRKLVHRFSLLHALMIMNLRNDPILAHLREELPSELRFATRAEQDSLRHGEHGNTLQLPLLWPMTASERSRIKHCPNRVIACYNRILKMVTERHVIHKGLKVPPPVLSRAYAVLSDAFTAYMQCKKIKDIPFPFAYAQLVFWLLTCFIASSPLVIAAHIRTWSLGCALSFLTTCGSVALNEVAQELEDPFGFEPNDLAATYFQLEFNRSILVSLVSATGAGDLAVFDEETEIIDSDEEEIEPTGGAWDRTPRPKQREKEIDIALVPPPLPDSTDSIAQC